MSNPHDPNNIAANGEPPDTERRFDALLDDAIAAEQASGRREDTVEKAKRHLVIRVALVVGGVVVTLLGLLMLVLPGPGFLVIFIGLGLLATEVPFAARLMDRVRKRLPQDEDGKIPRNTIIMMVAIALVFTAGSTLFGLSRR